MNKDLIYQCLECGRLEVVKASDPIKDGRQCVECGKHTTPIAYAGIDMGRNG